MTELEMENRFPNIDYWQTKATCIRLPEATIKHLKKMALKRSELEEYRVSWVSLAREAITQAYPVKAKGKKHA